MLVKRWELVGRDGNVQAEDAKEDYQVEVEDVGYAQCEAEDYGEYAGPVRVLLGRILEANISLVAYHCPYIPAKHFPSACLFMRLGVVLVYHSLKFLDLNSSASVIVLSLLHSLELSVSYKCFFFFSRSLLWAVEVAELIDTSALSFVGQGYAIS